MDYNKDEADLCTEYARRCVTKGKVDEAKKYLERAQELCPQMVLEYLLEQMVTKKSTRSNNENTCELGKTDSTNHISATVKMDCNKDEAERCVELAGRCICEDKLEEAKQFLIKAQRLYPKTVIKGLLDNLTLSSPSNSNTHGIKTSKKNDATTSENTHGSKTSKENDATPSENTHGSKTSEKNDATPSENMHGIKSSEKVDATSSVDCREEEAKRYLQLAEDCMNANNLTDAKKYILLSQKLHKTWKSVHLNKKLNQMFRQNSSNGNPQTKPKQSKEKPSASPNTKCKESEVERFTKLAERCIREKKLNEARKHLESAQRLHASEKIEELLRKVSSMSLGRTNHNSTRNKVRNPYCNVETVANKEQAKRCRELGERYIREKNLDEARKFLEKAQKLHPTEKTGELLERVLSMSSGSARQNLPNDGEKNPYENVSGNTSTDEAEVCVDLAERYIRLKRFDDAKMFLERAQKLHPCKRTSTLLKKVLTMSGSTGRKDSGTGRRNPYDGVSADANKDQAERCQELAERCIREKKFDEAKKYLEKAQRLHPTKKTKDLLEKVSTMSAENENYNASEPEVRNPYGGVGSVANKDQAEKCLELAENCISNKRYSDAEKYLKKAQKLYPTKKCAELLQKVTLLSSQKTNPPKMNAKNNTQGTWRRVPSPPTYTKEQMALVMRINRCKDHYELLGVTKQATITEIRQAYKKLALLLHPDKNQAPGATEAFRAMKNAVNILTGQKNNETERGFTHNHNQKNGTQNKESSKNHDFTSHNKDKGFNFDHNSNSNSNHTGYSNNYSYQNYRSDSGFNFNHDYKNNAKDREFSQHYDFRSNARHHGNFSYNHDFKNNAKEGEYNQYYDFKSYSKDKKFNYGHDDAKSNTRPTGSTMPDAKAKESNSNSTSKCTIQ